MSEVKNYWKESPVMILCLLVLVLAFSYAALDSLIRMEYIWGAKEEYGYAYIIPFISGYFIWQNSVKIKQVEFTTNWFGGLFLFFGLFLILLGVLSATHSITQYGYVFSIVSAALFFMGWSAFKIILGPLLLLFLAVPLPNFIFNNLSSDLQLISSQIGVSVIRLFGISVYLEGNVIDLGKFQLQVVEACSGLRYLFPLISLSIISAFIYQAAMWKRVVIVLSSLPITVLMNSFRIGVIGVLVEYYGIEQAEGFLHDFEGWIIFMACLGLLLLEMFLLVSFGKNKQKLRDVFAIEAPEAIPDDAVYQSRKAHWQYVVPSILVLLIGIYIGGLNERAEIIPDRKDFSSYPMNISGWKGAKSRIGQNILDELKLDDYIMADYQNSADGINLYLAYYGSQRSGAAAHSPKSCIPGGGWRIKSHKVIDIPGLNKHANRLWIQKGDYGQLVYYWFDQRGRNITNEYMVKWYLFWDSLTLGRTDGSLVRLTTTLEPGEDVVKADERLIKFAQLINPTLSDFIPE
ncbi:MAG: VPLPA-CTERM-specific exosortase XrtD [Methylococcales bacterium]